MIEVKEQFEVKSDADTVWKIISAPHEVVSCIPGATLEQQNEDGSYSGTLLVQFGPTRVLFRAKLTLDLDSAQRIGRLTAQGKDAQGGTRVKTMMTFQVSPVNAGAKVVGDGHVEISGRLASIIEGGASIVVKRMSGEFAANLEQRCTPVDQRPVPAETQPPPAHRGSWLSALWLRILHPLRRSTHKAE